MFVQGRPRTVQFVYCSSFYYVNILFSIGGVNLFQK
jgi:hypothetical protein